MKQRSKWFLVAGATLVALALAPVARADIDNASATNVQEGENDNETSQTGNAQSGDAIGGSVAGVAAGGDVSVDATNRSEDVEVTSGDANGQNTSNSFVGLTAGTSTRTGADASDIDNDSATNVQEGDNTLDLDQSATVGTGDAVGGQVLGVISTAGEVDIIAANTTEDADIESGEAEAFNDAAAFVGLNATGTVGLSAADIDNASATNVQEGDNEIDASQDALAVTGDGIGGQVLGVISAGRDPIHATNHSEDVDVETGDSLAENDFASFVGLTAGSNTAVGAADIDNDTAVNVQEGDNERELSQRADAVSGDGVVGQVAGVVSSTGGWVELVIANVSEDSSVTSGDAEFNNEDDSFSGLHADGVIDIF